MPGLMTTHTTPDGQRIMIESDLLEIDRRIKEGDPTIGWAGDPDMWIELDRRHNVFVVCRLDANAGPVDVCRYPAPLDAGLLIKLRDGDIRRPGNDPLGDAIAAEEKADADAAFRFDEMVDEEAAPRLIHAMHQAGADVPVTQKTFFPGETS